MQKRFISLFLVIILTVFYVPCKSFAAGGCEINVARAYIAPGGTGTISVSIKNNPGVIGMSFSVSWYDGLTLSDAKSGEAFSELNFTKPRKLSSGCIFTWYGEDIEDENIKDGSILTLTFSVDASVQIGQKLDVRIKVDNVFDKNLDSVAPVTNNGFVFTDNNENAIACVCGKVHTGPYAGIITFFHRIIYWLRRFFGAVV